jgi:predicted Zn-dependent peptidase
MTRHCHTNGLVHHHLNDHDLNDHDLNDHDINDNQGYSALVVVNTPALDDSGVSHAVEHLVFRRSAAFNQAESLFQLTALTDLAINASTHCNVTYYHCHSQNEQSYLLGLNYLLNGLLAPTFTEQDLRQETAYDKVYGVINRELTLQQTNEQLRQQAAANRSDTSAQRCYQYGGDIELVSQLTLADVTRYHAQYYQAHKMSLVTANIKVKEVADILHSIENELEKSSVDRSTINKSFHEPNTAERSICYQAKTMFDSTEYETDKKLIRWWINCDFFNYFSSNYQSLKQLINKVNAQLLPLDYNLNKQQKFPLDIIAPVAFSEEYLSHHLTCFILNTPNKEGMDSSKPQEGNRHKFSSSILPLYAYYQKLTSELTSPLAEQSTLAIYSPKNIKVEPKLLGKGVVHRLYKSAKSLKEESGKQQSRPLVNLTQVDNTLVENTLVSTLENTLVKNLPESLLGSLSEKSTLLKKHKHRTLPALFSHLVKESQQKNTLKKGQKSEGFDENHCLLILKVNKEEQDLAVIVSFIISAYPTFLAARIQGHCYATAAQYLEENQQLVLYSAFDVTPSLRIETMKAALLTLSKDKRFIKASLSLAKSKARLYLNASCNDACNDNCNSDFKNSFEGGFKSDVKEGDHKTVYVEAVTAFISSKLVA